MPLSEVNLQNISKTNQCHAHSHSLPQLFRAELGESLVLPCRVANLGEFVLMWKRNSRVLTAGNLVVRKDSR